MASQYTARLGIVMGINIAELETSVNEAIQKFGKLKNEIKRDVSAAEKELLSLSYAIQDYGKSLTKVEQIQREITSGRFLNASEKHKQLLLQQAKAYDDVAEAAKKANMAQMGGAGGKLPPHLQAALGYQTTDIVTSLLGGQNPMMVLIQQGGQLRDQFGGFVPLFKAITSVLTPMNVAIGAGAIVFGGLAFAAYKGQEEVSKFRDTLILTNNIAGVTASSFQMMSAALSDKLNMSIGKTNEVFMELIASGKFTSTSLSSVAKAIALVSKLSGETASTVAKDLMASLDGSAHSASKLNEKYNFLSFAQYKQIEALARQNKLQESVKLTADLLTASLTKQERDVGTLEKAWESLGKMFGSFWSDLKSIGKDKTTEDIIKNLKKDIEYLESTLNGLSGERNKTLIEQKKKQLEEMIAIQTKELQRVQAESDAQAKENAKTKAYEETGGAQKTADLIAEYQKLVNDGLFQTRVKGVNEFERIQLESAKRIQDYLVQQNASLEKDKFLRSELYTKNNVQFILNEQAKVAQLQEDISRKEALRITEKQQSELDSIAREREKLELYRDNILLSDNDKQIALDRLRTEQEIARLIKDQKLTGTALETAIQREKLIQAQKEGVIRLGEQLSIVQSIHTSVFNNMTAAIENFVRTGKFSFKDFTLSVIRGILEIEAKAQSAKLLSAAGKSIGGVFGSFFGGDSVRSQGFLNEAGGMEVGGSLGFADGGSPPVGVPSIVGERGPEMFIPRTAGTIIPNHALGAMGGTTINYNGTYVANMSAIDTQSATQFLVQNKQTIWAANQSASRSMPTSR
tara:strand:+ start:4078 stop:6486 length:2409 start_codon:yes stop_codon:yes gene_type:complete